MASEPVALLPIPSAPPVSLSASARRRWDRAVAALPAVGIKLAVTDAVSLVRWAVLTDRLDVLNAAINEGRAAGEDVDRLLRTWLRLSAVADGLGRQFGMDPASRKRIGATAPAPAANDEFESFRPRGQSVKRIS